MAQSFDEYVLFTGGHTGIGLGVTEKILKEHPNTKLGLIIRSESRKSQTIDAFQKDLPDIKLEERIDFFYADLSDQTEIRSAAQQVAKAWPQLDKIFCNAGIVPSEYHASSSGNEMSLEINALAHVILVQELTPLLTKTPGASVMVTTTDGMKGRKLDVAIFDDKNKSGLFGYYAQAKQAAMLMLLALASNEDFHFRAVNPGPNKTKMTSSKDLPWIIRLLGPLMFKDSSVGTGRIYRAAYDYPDDSKVWFDYDKKVQLRVDALSESDKTVLMSKIKA